MARSASSLVPLTVCALGLLAIVAPTRRGEPQATPGDKPAEEVFKNIQVLKGMPASQMFPVMHFMRASLGVRCDFCHVAENGKFDLDTKPEKKTAREMIQMTLAINKNNFEGHTEVTCNSCHRGQTRPVAVPPIGQGQFPDTTRGEPKPKEKLPSAAEVLDRYIEALGGKERLAAVTRRVSRGTVLRGKVVDSGTPKATMVNRGEEDPIEIVQEAPARLTATLGPPARIVERFDGTAGTVETPEGRHPMNPQEARHIAAEADLGRELKLRERADKMRVVARDSLDGREVYVVRGALADGRRATFYFDVGTGLLARQIVMNPTLLGNDPEQTDYSDYRDAGGGLKLPYVVKTSYLDDNHLGTTRKWTEIRNEAGSGKR